jgi:hypothetical protein
MFHTCWERTTEPEEGDTTSRKTQGRQQWHNRQRGKPSLNKPCLRVTRWTKVLR